MVLGLVAKEVGSQVIRYLPDREESYKDTISKEFLTR